MISNNLKLFRMKNNLSQSKLAEQVNVSRVTINSIEKGKSIPHIDVALRIASVFKKNVEEIFFIQPVKNNQKNSDTT